MRWWLKVLPNRFFPFWQGQVLAVACVCGAVFLRMALAPFIGDDAPFSPFFPALLIASVWGGPWSGLTVLILSAGIVSVFWLPARWDWGLAPSAPLFVIAFTVLAGFVIAIAMLLRALVHSHQASEERAKILAQEMQHRVNNLLALVGTISSQTARGAATVTAHQALFTERLHALARAQALAVECPRSPMVVRVLLEHLLDPFDIERFTLMGPETIVADEICLSLALLVHELGTNAMKYGALSVPAGRVEIVWMVGQRGVELDWRETGGPLVEEPLKVGFGSRLMRAAFPSEIGEVQTTFLPEGLHCLMRFRSRPV